MGRRIDFHDDPTAPKANSIVPSVNVAVFNDAGELLLIRRSGNENWALPGGGDGIGGAAWQGGARGARRGGGAEGGDVGGLRWGGSVGGAGFGESAGEGGMECGCTGRRGIYPDRGQVMLYRGKGEVRQEFSCVLTGRVAGGGLAASSETLEARWVPPAEVSGYQMDSSMRLRVEHVLSGDGSPHLG